MTWAGPQFPWRPREPTSCLWRGTSPVASRNQPCPERLHGYGRSVTAARNLDRPSGRSGWHGIACSSAPSSSSGDRKAADTAPDDHAKCLDSSEAPAAEAPERSTHRCPPCAVQAAYQPTRMNIRHQTNIRQSLPGHIFDLHSIVLNHLAEGTNQILDESVKGSTRVGDWTSFKTAWICDFVYGFPATVLSINTPITKFFGADGNRLKNTSSGKPNTIKDKANLGMHIKKYLVYRTLNPKTPAILIF